MWEKRAVAGKGSPPPFLSPVPCRFIFVFALSKFRGSDHLGAWNRLGFSVLLLRLPMVLSFHFGISFSSVFSWLVLKSCDWLRRYGVCKKTCHWLECHKMHLYTAKHRYSWNNEGNAAEPRYKKGTTDWQNTFAVSRFFSIIKLLLLWQRILFVITRTSSYGSSLYLGK